MNDDHDHVSGLFAQIAREQDMIDQLAAGAERLQVIQQTKAGLGAVGRGFAEACHRPPSRRVGGQRMSAGIVAVDELSRAYQAAIGGEFRTGHRNRSRSASGGSEWSPAAGEQVVAVVGCLGGAGASTVALGLATSAGSARVVECCTVATSGLAGASSAELGITADGWVQGSREEVLIERRSDRIEGPSRCPAPTATTVPLTILDCAWDVDLLTADAGWLGTTVREARVVVAVTRPTIPGLRRLEAALGLLGSRRTLAVVVGIEKRWPKAVQQALGPYARELRAAGRLVEVPHDPILAITGLTPEPLPTAALSGCSALLTHLEGRLR